MTLQEAFGKVMREIRLKREISQEELGAISGYHRTYISLLERGHKSPSLTTVFDLAEALGCESSQIIAQVEFLLHPTSNNNKRGLK